MRLGDIKDRKKKKRRWDKKDIRIGKINKIEDGIRKLKDEVKK